MNISISFLAKLKTKMRSNINIPFRQLFLHHSTYIRIYLHLFPFIYSLNFTSILPSFVNRRSIKFGCCYFYFLKCFCDVFSILHSTHHVDNKTSQKQLTKVVNIGAIQSSEGYSMTKRKKT